jgi:asparagine synthase (glutamine-hydrolysing)
LPAGGRRTSRRDGGAPADARDCAIRVVLAQWNNLMCGISGWYLEPGEMRSGEGLRAMARALHHRGPDDLGFFEDPRLGIGFAHNRLSIIDLSPRGHQPMMTRDRSLVLNYNGEIFNFKELRAELESLGRRFESDCDTEVVLQAFDQWGPRCVERLRGMFAFAIWSPTNESMFLARDPLGIKPLYYSTAPGGRGFLFASEIKAFLALKDFPVQLNRDALEQFLEFGFTCHEHESSLEGVRKLPPGHTLTVSRGRIQSLNRYFTPPVPDDGMSLEDRAEELYETLSQVVSQHLIADVPVALLLSGGVDSSIIAALAARKSSVRTLTMAFGESGIDERGHARIVSDHIGSQHQEILIPPHEIYGNLDQVVWTVDDLFSDWGVVSTRLLYQRAREAGVKVVLVGEGADEIFGGYPQFQEFADSRPTAANLFRLYRRYAGRRYGRGFFRFRSILKNHLQRTRGDLFGAIRLFEIQNQLPNNYVMKVDKASMAESVEARVPYLDRRVAEIALRTPKSQLVRGSTAKVLLRVMAERHALLPPVVLARPKFGASIAASWMDDSVDFRQYSRQVILDKNGWVDELGLRNAMTDFFDRGRTGYRFPRAISIFRNLAWRLLLLNLWSRKYLGTQGVTR